MDDTVFVIILTLEIILAVAIIGKTIINYCNLKLKEMELQRTLYERSIDAKEQINDLSIMQTRIDYSKSVMEYIHAVVTEQAIIEFRNFLDSHVLNKVTRLQVAHVVDDLANKVKDHIQLENIQFNDTIMSEEFFMQYIISISVDSVKQLLDKAIQVYVDEEGDDQNG